jgi:hypothetical protein
MGNFNKMLLIGILFLFINNVQPVYSATSNSDCLDQMQPEYTGDYGKIHEERSWAQSFQPSYAILSRIQLFIKDSGSSGEITVSIRKDRNDKDLTSIKKSTSLISDHSYNWVEFDFSDIQVEEGQTYYIICRHSVQQDLFWAASSNDPYDDGKAYFKTSNSNRWEAWENDLPFPYSFDLCFKTFGLEHRPNKPMRPEGPSQVKKGKTVTFTTVTTDLDGDQIKYGWDFDNDEQVDKWTSFHPSNKTVMINHSWNDKDVYLIKVIAEDDKGFQSEWSPSMSVSVPKYRLRTIEDIFNYLFHLIKCYV